MARSQLLQPPVPAARQHRCPGCGSLTIDRAPSRVVPEAVLRLLGRRRYACRECGRVFWDRPLRGAYR